MEQRPEAAAGLCMRARLVFLGILMALPTSGAHAWNGRGHMIAAAVAWDHMDADARKRAGVLLKLNPFYSGWVKGVPASQRDQIAFVIAATWPDAIKKWMGSCPAHVTPNAGPVSKYTYCNDSDTPKHEGADANTGYTDRLEHKYWHFIDIPFSPDNTPLVQPVPPSARTQIPVLSETIGSNTASDELKSYDLVWLEHLVGDVHQPLHATSRFTKTFRDGDEGGNRVCTGTALAPKPHNRSECKTELHAFWDNALGLQKKGPDASNATAAIKIASTLEPADHAKANDANLGDWINESFELAKSASYASPVGQGLGPYDVQASDAYKSNTVSVARKQIELAGERLANLLNARLQ